MDRAAWIYVLIISSIIVVVALTDTKATGPSNSGTVVHTIDVINDD